MASTPLTAGGGGGGDGGRDCFLFSRMHRNVCLLEGPPSRVSNNATSPTGPTQWHMCSRAQTPRSALTQTVAECAYPCVIAIPSAFPVYPCILLMYGNPYASPVRPLCIPVSLRIRCPRAQPYSPAHPLYVPVSLVSGVITHPRTHPHAIKLQLRTALP